MYIYIYSKINEIWEELDGGVKRKMKRVEEEEEEEWKANETKLDGLWTDEKRIYRERGKREGEGEGGEDGREGWRGRGSEKAPRNWQSNKRSPGTNRLQWIDPETAFSS